MNLEDPDHKIISSVLSGDRDAFAMLVRRYQNLVFSLILRRIKNRDTAEEIAQDVFIRAYGALSSFRFESKFSTWLIRIALNLAYNHQQSKAYTKSKRTESIDQQVFISQDPIPDEALAHKQLKQLFEDCFRKLSQKLSETLLLAGLQGLSYEEAADVMGIPLGTVRSRLNQARLLVSECMRKEASL